MDARDSSTSVRRTNARLASLPRVPAKLSALPDAAVDAPAPVGLQPYVSVGTRLVPAFMSPRNFAAVRSRTS